VNEKKEPSAEEKMLRKVESDARLKIRARGKEDTVVFGLGMFGIVGWSIVVPTVMGIALGVYLDGRVDSGFSWTLTLLFTGVIVGCINAWYWVKQKSERR
jgi:ATP synthase protein I